MTYYRSSFKYFPNFQVVIVDSYTVLNCRQYNLIAIQSPKSSVSVYVSSIPFSLSFSENIFIHISQDVFPFISINKKQKRSRRPVTSFARFHIIVCKALGVREAERWGFDSRQTVHFDRIRRIRRMHNRELWRFSLTVRATVPGRTAAKSSRQRL